VRILVPLGTRPEIIKLAPVVGALRKHGHDVEVLATGQHYDPNLTDAFFDELGLTPGLRWHLEGSEAHRVATILERAIDLVPACKPDVVLLLGDTNTVPLFSLAARRAGVPVAHLEAGLRSFNPTSAEEVNRLVGGALASLHFAPTLLAARFLAREGVPDIRVRVVGNPIIDVLRQSGVCRSPLGERRGVVVTAHRATNVDDPARLATLVELVRRLALEVGPVTFPVHPRTRSRLEEAGLIRALRHPAVDVLDPVPWSAMLGLLARSRVIVTDSGGLQEEASWLGVPVVVLRRSTPRWEGVKARTAVLTGMDADRATTAAGALSVDDEQARVAATPCLYGDGNTSELVASVLDDPATAALLTLDEPDFLDLPPQCR
jgi:UDP-N-acetylglucosamine 2-epimerase (non-hydrolysing)